MEVTKVSFELTKDKLDLLAGYNRILIGKSNSYPRGLFNDLGLEFLERFKTWKWETKLIGAFSVEGLKPGMYDSKADNKSGLEGFWWSSRKQNSTL